VSRSKKKHPAGKVTTAKSEKRDKVKAHRALRVAERRSLSLLGTDLDTDFPVIRNVSDVWAFEGDGKSYWNNAPARHYRK